MKSRKSSLADDDDSHDYEPPRKFQREERRANKARASQGMLLPGLALPGLPGLNIPAQLPQPPPEVFSSHQGIILCSGFRVPLECGLSIFY